MDTKDKDSEQQKYASEIMMPDSAVFPGILELQTDAEVTEIITPEGTVAEIAKPSRKKSPTPLQDSLRRLRRDVRAMISLGAIVLFILIPLFGPIIYQHIGGPYQGNFGVIGPELSKIRKKE